MARRPPATPQTSTEPQTGPAGGITARDVIDRYHAGTKPLRAQHFNFWLNEAYVTGDQWLHHNTRNNQIEPMPNDEDRLRLVSNHMWPSSRTIIAKAVQRPLQFYVPPTGADDATLKGAKTAESILIDLQREHDWEGIREDVHWAAWMGGTAAIRIVWDAAAGQPLGMTDDGKHYGTGDTAEDVLSITDFCVEPGARDAEHARWWMTCIGLPPKKVQEMFSMAEEPAPDGTTALSPFHQSVLGMDDTNKAGETMIPLTRVYTLYQRPTPDDTKGHVISVVADQIVDNVAWPFPFKDRLNMVVIRETRRNGTWVGETVLKSARPIQNAINHAWSAIVEHIKMTGNARLMVPESMMEQIEQLTDLPGEILPFPDGLQAPAQYLSPPQMPGWEIDAPDRLKNEMDDILGVHEVSRGDAPGRVDSGLAISILVEQDTTPIGRFVKETAGAFGRLATMALELYEANVKETRKAVVKTPGQPARTHNWTGKDLMNQVQAEVPLDSITPRNQAADEARASKLLQMGLITTMDEWFKIAQIPQDRDQLEALSPDVAKARRENASMALGEINVPEPFDDHVDHISEHHTMMKSAEWDIMDPKFRETFTKHCKAHEVLAAEAMGRATAKGQVAPALGAAASATGDPVVPMDSLPGGPNAAPPGSPPPLPGNPNSAGQVELQNPGVPTDLIENEVGPIQGVSA